MSARQDVIAVAGQPLDLMISVVFQTDPDDPGIRVIDLDGLGYVLQARSEIDDSVLVTKSAPAGQNNTLAGSSEFNGDPGPIASFRITLTASDLNITFSRPALERTIPVRSLPYRFWLVDGDGDEEEVQHGYIHVRANVVEGDGS